MTNCELLKELVAEATELLNYANAGGRFEYAFNLTANSEELDAAYQLIFDHGTRIRAELTD